MRETAENYDFKNKPKTRQIFFDTLFGCDKNHSNKKLHTKILDALCWLEIEYLDLTAKPPHFREIHPQEEFDKLRPQSAHTTPMAYVHEAVTTIQLMIIKQNHDDQTQIIEKRMALFMRGVKIIYENFYPYDATSKDIHSLWEFIKGTVIKSILWQYDERIIKNAIVKHVLYRSLKNNCTPQYFFQGMELLIKRKFSEIYNPSTGACITLNDQIFPELERACEEEYFQITIPTSFSPEHRAAVILGITGLASLALSYFKSSLFFIPFFPGLLFTWKALTEDRKISRKLSQESMLAFFNEFITNEETISHISARSPFTPQEILTRLTPAVRQQTCELMFNYQIRKHRARTYLQKIPTKPGEEEKILFARQDMIEAYETSQKTNEPISARRYMQAAHGLNITELRAAEDARRAANVDENARAAPFLIEHPALPEEQIFRWGAAYFTLTCILPYRSQSGAIQFIALATHTLRAQIQNAHLNPDDVINNFYDKFVRTAESGHGDKKFKKLRGHSNRDLSIHGEKYPGKFDHQLAISNSPGRIFFHTVAGDPTRPPLFLGCWFDECGLHKPSDKTRFKTTKRPIVIDESDYQLAAVPGTP